jgi:hypothetical protein
MDGPFAASEIDVRPDEPNGGADEQEQRVIERICPEAADHVFCWSLVGD